MKHLPCSGFENTLPPPALRTTHGDGFLLSLGNTGEHRVSREVVSPVRRHTASEGNCGASRALPGPGACDRNRVCYYA